MSSDPTPATPDRPPSGPPDRPTGGHPVDPTAIKVGDLMAFTYYAVVLGKEPRHVIGQVIPVQALQLRHVGDAAGIDTFEVTGESLIRAAHSADYAAEQRKVSKTEAAELLTRAHNRPLTVCFVKQDGNTRVLRGRLVSSEPLLGRSYCEDLDLTPDEAGRKGGRLRLVDHRTISYLIVDGVKYVVR